MITIINPTTIKLEGFDDIYDKLKTFLSYKDKTVQYEIQRHKHAHWFVNKFGREAFEERLQELKDKQVKCILWENKGDLFTYSGLANEIASKFNRSINDEVKRPTSRPMGWNKQIEFELRPYQKKAIETLLKYRHASISLPTGAGKSQILLHIIKELGLKTVVMAPSVSIATQLYDLFRTHLGAKYVGMLGNGKRQTNKLITIGIAASLTRIKEGSKEWNELNKCQVFCADESHLTPAETFKQICTGLVSTAPYRFFVSATQMRNDGSDLLLKGIIGPTVLEYKASELIDQGYLAKPNFFIVRAYSKSNYASRDAMRMISNHLYNNVELHEKVAKMAEQSITLLGHKVLIMIDHIEQFKYLLPHFTHKPAFAHGGVTDKNAHYIPEEYHKSDPNELVKEFNKGNIPILVGTGVISLGTDIKPVNDIYNLQSGTSEVKFKQVIGRGTRKVPGKDSFNYIDFDIQNIPQLHNHTNARIDIYRQVYDNVKFI